jgi:hypothetical protein
MIDDDHSEKAGFKSDVVLITNATAAESETQDFCKLVPHGDGQCSSGVSVQA